MAYLHLDLEYGYLTCRPLLSKKQPPELLTLDVSLDLAELFIEVLEANRDFKQYAEFLRKVVYDRKDLIRQKKEDLKIITTTNNTQITTGNSDE